MAKCRVIADIRLRDDTGAVCRLGDTAQMSADWIAAHPKYVEPVKAKRKAKSKAQKAKKKDA